MKNEWIVSGWKNGGADAKHRTWGLRLGKKLRHEIFVGKPPMVRLRLPDGTEWDAAITPSFWRSCPEIRHRAIGAWLKTRNLNAWPRGNPPRFVLRRVGENHFSLAPGIN